MLKKFLALPFKLQIEIVLYPIFLLYRMPVAWIKSLWEARVLLGGRWSRYMGFHPHNAINSFFYRTQWLNLERYGKNHNSPVIGLGDYSLRNWFHLSLPASLIYSQAGAATTLFCTLAWIVSHIVWAHTDSWWVIAIVLTLFFSTTSYAMAFSRQNYQMLGWMWVPLALYFAQTGQPLPATLTWFVAGLFSITVVFCAIPIVLSMSAMLGDSLLLFTLAPALIYAALRFLPLLKKGEVQQAIYGIAKVIGATQSKVLYRRDMRRLGFVGWYFSALYTVTALLMSVAIGEVAVLPLLAAALFFINQRLFRVADEQSMIVISCSLFVFTTLQAPADWLAFIALWVAVNPIAWIFAIQSFDNETGDGKILVYPPFDHTLLEEGVGRFLESTGSNDRIYFAFDHPRGRYANIFDGYRVIHELSLHVASAKEVHLFPDWWAVTETNYEGAPQLWGRSVHDVIENCDAWNAEFAIIYQESGTYLDERWSIHFDCFAQFDWADYQHLFKGVRLWSKDKPTPKWFLLKRRS